MTARAVNRRMVVKASQERAFKVFTEGIDRWWPREHHIGASPLKREVLEPKLHGRWYAISQDGSECEVGKVLVWEPFSRLVVTWQINADWAYAADFVTEIEVTFTAEGQTQTRIDFVHRHLERYGAKADELVKVLGSPSGWGSTLDAFTRAAEER